MFNNTPATPAQAATPGNESQKGNQPPVTTPPSSNNGELGSNQEGKVTISTKEFAQLQRDAARARSSDRRANLAKNKMPPVNDQGDPQAAEAIREANDRAARAEREALQHKIKDRTRSLLETEEFKNIPQSAKNIILNNPYLLSESDDLEEAMLDVEDFIRDNVVGKDSVQITNDGGNKDGKSGDQPKGHETPPAGGTTPSTPNTVELEDVSKLSGPTKTAAMIRNAIKTKGKQQSV